MDTNSGAVKNPALRRLWRQGSIIRHCGSPTGMDYFSLAVGGVSARFMVALTLSRAAGESAFLLSSPSSRWLAWLAAASASFSSWSAVKNTALFMLRLPVVISVSSSRLDSPHRSSARALPVSGLTGLAMVVGLLDLTSHLPQMACI
jgi:hypothetical protein